MLVACPGRLIDHIGCGNVVKVDKATGTVTGIFTGGPDGMSSPRVPNTDPPGHAYAASAFVNPFVRQALRKSRCSSNRAWTSSIFWRRKAR